jgi:membrane-associated protein
VIDFLADGVPYYPAMFGACVLSGMFWPWPEDVPLVYAGMCIAAGRADWGLTLLAAGGAVAIRDLIAFFIGRVVGELLLERPMVIRLVGVRRLMRAKQLIDDYDARAVLAGRFFVGMRAPIFIVAGAMGVPLRRFLVWDGIGLAIVIPTTLILGYTFGQPLLDGFLAVWHGTRWLGPIAVLAVVAWRVARAARRAQLASTAGATDEDD